MDKEAIRNELRDLEKKVREKKLTQFWVMADREDFKVIRMSSDALRAYFTEKEPYYRNKRVANIRIHVVPDNVDSRSGYAYSVVVTIIELDDKAQFQTRPMTSYSIALNIMPADVEKIKFSLKFVESLMRLLALPEQRLRNNVIAGETYTQFKKRLQREGVAWEY